MCDVQAKLIAWLDRELPTDEASAVERHVERCEECRRWIATYGQVGQAFDAYCDAVMAAKAPRQVPRWVPVLSGAVVVAGALFLALPRMRVERPLVGRSPSAPFFLALEAERTHEGVRLIVWKKAASDLFGSDPSGSQPAARVCPAVARVNLFWI